MHKSIILKSHLQTYWFLTCRRKVLISWTQQKRPVGRPKQTIRHGYATTVVKSLGFDNAGLNSWMTVAKDHSSWAQQVELHLELPTDTYKPFKQRRN